MTPLEVAHRTIQVDGLSVFYREAGHPAAPTILLLHGFPSSSHMFRKLIPLLADHYHVIAPDLPGFGYTEVPLVRQYHYSFENLAKTIDAFTEGLGLNRFAIYVLDYGAPVGFRLSWRIPNVSPPSFLRTAMPTSKA
jgi:pimeloyl-ACP methyl ester carboxylesterase